MKTAELLTYFGRLKGMPGPTARQRASQLLHKYNLGEWEKKKCEALSKGMAQKVQVLSALIHGSELVVLDEPFSGLDPVNLEVVRDMILELKEQGKTVIFSTHLMEHAGKICQHILLINKGEKILNGPLTGIKARAGKSVVIDYQGEASALANLEGVTRVSNAGNTAELLLKENIDPHSVLQQLVGRVKIRRFSDAQKSLHEIFIDAVGGGKPPKMREILKWLNAPVGSFPEQKD